MFSAQYILDCLEEYHICHGITTQEPRPRPMKKTLQSRHNLTVLPRPCSGRTESLQNLHTHTVDYAIELLDHNSLLKECPPPPPPIAEDKLRLNQTQRCCLSHLRSGHFHLLQDGNHRMFGKPSNIYIYYRASPQDERHLFACNAHPTDLSPCHRLTTDLVMVNNDNKLCYSCRICVKLKPQYYCPQ